MEKKSYFNEKMILKNISKIMNLANKWTITDIRSHAKRSINKKGKLNKKTGRREPSRPGEPPKKITGILYRSIMYGRDGDTWYAGPIRYEGKSHGAKLLEHGGNKRQKINVSSYVHHKPKKSKIKTRCKKHNSYRSNRPKSKNGTPYTYFYSREEWESARTSGRFIEWAKKYTSTKTIDVHIEERPFMRPAFNDKMKNYNEKVDRARKFYSRSQ